MRYLGLLLVIGLASGLDQSHVGRIIGGSPVSIEEYPHIVALLYSNDLVTYTQFCGGSIINQRSVLTAAQCIFGDVTSRIRFRAGSSYAHSGGNVYRVQSYAIHPDYEIVNYLTYNNDVAILKAEGIITFSDTARAAFFASTNYYLGDNEPVWAAGWGRTSFTGEPSEELNHVEIYTVNHDECVKRFETIGRTVTDGMVCAGLLDIGGKDQCYGDGGGPLQHQGIVVAITSWGEGCADPYFPGVNARVSNFFDWINANA